MRASASDVTARLLTTVRTARRRMAFRCVTGNALAAGTEHCDGRMCCATRRLSANSNCSLSARKLHVPYVPAPPAAKSPASLTDWWPR